MRTLSALALAALLAGPLSAQELTRPDDWRVRFDMPGASESDLETFVSMPPGWHVTTGPAAIFWGPEMTASGAFRVEMEVFLFDPRGLREAFGVFLGGSDLEGDGQEYVYFLIRDGGQFIIKRRAGAQAPTIRDWTSHNAIRSYADRGEEVSVRNVLVVEAGDEVVRFLVNDTEVARMPRSELRLDGVYGMRVNHGLNVHVSALGASPLR